MKIALDYREAAKPKRAGKGEYVFQLTRSMVALAPDIHFILLVENGQVPNNTAPNCQIKTIPVRGALWHLWVILWLTFAKPVDIYMATVSVIIPALVFRVPVATTIFDFTPWRFPATHNSWATVVEKLFMGTALLRSKWLLAISEFTKQEAVDIFGINPEKITVTKLGVDTAIFSPPKNTAEVLENVRTKYHLPPKFLLYLGTIEPRKNITAIIQAFKEIQPDYLNLSLVLAGNRGWYSNQILAKTDPNILVTGYIDDADRPAIYALSAGFIFPSLYEGFGLPPLEAMAMGVPTIVSDRASLPEVAGQIATTVSLENPQELTLAIQKYLDLSSAELKLWQAQARSWAERFSWASTARATLTAIGYDK